MGDVGSQNGQEQGIYKKIWSYLVGYICPLCSSSIDVAALYSVGLGTRALILG